MNDDPAAMFTSLLQDKGFQGLSPEARAEALRQKIAQVRQEQTQQQGVALKGADIGLTSPTAIVGQHPGMVAPGNVDLTTRPDTRQPDGSHSSVHSESSNENGMEVLYPTIADDGRQMTSDEAWAQYKRTGKHLGKFATVDAANAYADKLHRQQAGEFNAPTKPPLTLATAPDATFAASLMPKANTARGLQRLAPPPVATSVTPVTKRTAAPHALDSVLSQPGANVEQALWAHVFGP